ncbi:hypothetical protein BJP40_24310 [Streptomyces sp. CC53]|uniref:antitoxin n=1 Tax=unclassified Streptomyces TaxID=2593676 RepID=UPI0008DE981A|nr:MULTISPECIES: antitoxin [unclassified Streptomyces]OII63471.1 hypothetical protein BJP40_24310 [Streptomyces sp. CC53]OII68383.1 hypothetical protein BJP39_21635 [Streptomyces sp. CC77]
MGIVDSLKARMGPARERVAGFARQHGDRIDHGIDRAAQAVDRKTKGKYSDKIESGTGKARHAMDRLSHRNGGSTPPEPPPAT